jgi:ankyrin repeat protein
VTQAGDGKLERVREILEAGADIDGVCEQTIRTALMAAVGNKRYKMVEFLLASGADPNRKNKGGVGAVTHAAEFCNVRSLKLLVRHGVDLSENSFENHFALWNVSFVQGDDRKACEEMVRLMFGLGMRHQKWPERRASSTPIFKALQGGRSLEVVKLLLANGADVEQRNASGYNALHAGIMAENIKVLDFLIKAELDLEAKSNFGNTPLILCSKFVRKAEAVGMFVKAGASVHARNDKGETALMWAAHMSLGSVRALVEGGAKVNEVDLEGDTALMKAAGVILSSTWWSMGRMWRLRIGRRCCGRICGAISGWRPICER